MCGICATLPPDPELVSHALEILQPRGPDGQGVLHTDFASLGVTRLAITDVVGGEQPLRSSCGRFLVAFNGEIYNHAELRLELERSGLSFASRSDGEVIHGLYQRHGLAFADRLDGMFAIALVDLTRRRLVLAVDPVGIKPLYLAETPSGGWVAASTVQALPPEFQARARWLEPGTVWTSDGESRTIRPSDPPQGSLLDEMRRAVHLQIPSEVPWGVLLSGGLDSGLVAALAAEPGGYRPVVAYTVGAPGSEDAAAARRLASELGLEHREIPVRRRELPALVEQVIEATATYDPYVVMSGVGTFLAGRAASQDGIKVLLTGEGADELFAGYAGYSQLAPEALEPRLLDDQRHLGVTECLRLDRCTMAWGVEARVPFLSPRVVALAGGLAPNAKVRDGVGKVALREAAREKLPGWVLERRKIPFFEGAGLFRPLGALALQQMPPERFERTAAEHPEFSLDTPLTAWLFTLWRQRFPRLGSSLDDLVVRGLIRRR